MGYGHLLQKTQLGSTQQDFLKKINASTGALLRIINDILNVSRIEAGKLVLEEVDFSLAECPEWSADTIAVQAHAKGLDFRVVSASDTPDLLRGDPFRLEQVLLNLLGNALKFTEKGVILLSVAPVEQASGGRILSDCRRSRLPLSSSHSPRQTTPLRGVTAEPGWGSVSASDWWS